MKLSMIEIGLVIIAVIAIAIIPIYYGDKKDAEISDVIYYEEAKALKATIRQQKLEIKYFTDALKTKDTIIKERTQDYYRLVDDNTRLVKSNSKLIKKLTEIRNEITRNNKAQ